MIGHAQGISIMEVGYCQFMISTCVDLQRGNNFAWFNDNGTLTSNLHSDPVGTARRSHYEGGCDYYQSMLISRYQNGSSLCVTVVLQGCSAIYTSNLTFTADEKITTTTGYPKVSSSAKFSDNVIANVTVTPEAVDENGTIFDYVIMDFFGGIQYPVIVDGFTINAGNTTSIMRWENGEWLEVGRVVLPNIEVGTQPNHVQLNILVVHGRVVNVMVQDGDRNATFAIPREPTRPTKSTDTFVPGNIYIHSILGTCKYCYVHVSMLYCHVK